MSWLQIQKPSFWSVVFCYSTQQQTISQSDNKWQKGDFIQPAKTSSVVGLKSSKILPKAKLAPKTGHGHCLVACCLSDPLIPFWILAKPLYLRSMLSKSMRCTENCNTTVNRMGPILPQNICLHVPQPMLQKFKELGYEVLLHSSYSPDLLPTTHHFLKHPENFLQRECFHNQQEAENAFQEFVKSQSTDFYSTRINKLISRWQKCAACNGSYFDE